MLNFFRKLRRKEMKSGRYLKYAIGEIFLVVIGILIALGISNYNETLKTRRWEAKFLKDIHKELESDIKQLEDVFEKQSIIRTSSIQVINLIKKAQRKDFKKIDSIYTISQSFNPTFFPATGVYDSGLSTGKIEDVQNDELKYDIMNLYNHYYDRLVYNGGELDDVVGRVDWEKVKYYDETEFKIRSWEAAMNFEFLAQINSSLSQVTVYTNIAERTLNEMKRVAKLIGLEIKD